MRIDKKKEIRPSILDRLIDLEPHLKVEAEIARHQYVRDLRLSVKRDLENILNTRYRMRSTPEHLMQVERSVINYGLPDLATLNIRDLDKKRQFVRDLERTIKRFEPRFKSVRVQHIDNTENHERTLRFRIDATLYADPAPEIIVFDSVLDPVHRTVKVEESPYG